MAYVTRVRRERVTVDELVRRVQADEEARRAARMPAEPSQRPSPASATVAGR